MIWEIDDQKPKIEGLDAQGRPDPAYAAALGLLRAPFGRRALAATTDVGIWVLVVLPFLIGTAPLLVKLATGAISPYGFLNHPDFIFAVVMASVSTLLGLVYLIVQLVLHGTKGMTIGKAVTGIRSVNVRTLERPRVGAVLARFLMVVASGVVPLLGPVFLLISPTFDPERRGRGLHDKATGIWLVDVRTGLNPYAEKRMRVARKMVKAEPNLGRSTLPSLATPTDPAAQPEYRPGSRVSAGVLGMARPHEAHERPTVGLPPATPAAQAPAEAGKPVLGGYRIADDEKPAAVAGSPAAPMHPEPAPVSAPVQSAAPQPGPVPPPAPQREPAPQPGPVPPPAPQREPAPQPEPVQPPSSQPEPAARFGLRFDSGESIPITAPVLLGRNPDAAQHPGASAIALSDDSKSLSKTHMLVRPVEGGLEIVDCRSTNGSGLIRAGTEYAVAAGTPTMATDGDKIRLGDRVAAVVRV
ncbi:MULTISPECIES: RDD family protein [unclassified Microbacterium]|uniref:RDD family protein n=1 Tax=unclassified Microbacterium TaxID=2609290 RepID=UPI00214C738A|nr:MULTISPECIES: RDD family protein [unclassified Microbacterium]MCR2811339.1 RDD family protein [Microbacterium sp. zg.B185]WIM18335.1 RDD family protein [Microbacterium sp. zg-B185]